MIKRSLLAFALAAALPLSAQAGEVNYNFVQAGYASTNIDTLNADFNGWNLEGSVGFSDNFYAFGGYTTGDKNSVNFNQTQLGLGWHTAGPAQWFGELSWINNEVDFGGGVNDNDNGYRVAGGVRGFLGDKFEGKASLNYTDVGNFGDGIGTSLSGVYHFNDTWGAYASYDYSDRSNTSINTWGLGVRASF